MDGDKKDGHAVEHERLGVPVMQQSTPPVARLMNARPSRSTTLYRLTLLSVVGAGSLFFELGGSHTLGSHEVFVAVPAREMLCSGDWLVPRYGGLPRLEKPPLAYWVAASVSGLLGRVDEWTVRLPSAVAAVALAMLVGFWTTRWYGSIPGFGAALTQLTTVWGVVYARKAEVDMLLCLLTTSCLFLIAGTLTSDRTESRRRSRLRWCGIYALLGLSWLAKFHYGPAMVLGPCSVYIVVTRRYRRLSHLINPVGWMLLAAAIVVWPMLVLQRFPEAWEIWSEQTLGRAVGGMGRDPVWFYLPQLVGLSLPWTPLILFAAPKSWKRAWKGGDARERFLWNWFLVQLAILTTSSDKHPNYVLALLPMFSILAGCGFVRLVSASRGGRVRLSFRSAIVASVLVVSGSWAAWWQASTRWPSLASPLATLALVWVSGAVIVILLLVRGRAQPAGYALLLLVLAVVGIAHKQVLPLADHRFSAAQFARQVRRQKLRDQNVAVYRLDQAHSGLDPVVFYLGEPVTRVESAEALRERLHRQRKLFVVTYQTRTEELERIGVCQSIERMAIATNHPPPRHPRLVLVELSARSEQSPIRNPWESMDDSESPQRSQPGSHSQS